MQPWRVFAGAIDPFGKRSELLDHARGGGAGCARDRLAEILVPSREKHAEQVDGDKDGAIHIAKPVDAGVHDLQRLGRKTGTVHETVFSEEVGEAVRWCAHWTTRGICASLVNVLAAIEFPQGGWPTGHSTRVSILEAQASGMAVFEARGPCIPTERCLAAYLAAAEPGTYIHCKLSPFLPLHPL